ncbi:MAG TPA: hypothetical protein VJB87_03085 [Candidatus Nanoarchaeia archaeon]|nr:hypothetical protein [Candidatus Nanoarchaeia archaeon]
MGVINYGCLKTATFVGSCYHGYSLVLKNDHFAAIYNDFAEGRFVGGSLKLVVPFLVPYVVSLDALRKTEKRFAKQLVDLKARNAELERRLGED